MKVILPDSNDILAFTDVPTPELSPDGVLIRVHAAGVNRADLLQRAGSYPPPPGCPDWMGLEVAGEIVRKGACVPDHIRIGDRVAALLGGGGYAEYAAVRYDMTFPLPDSLSFAEGAAIPETYATAYLNLTKEANMQPGETLLVFAGASGVGIAATQLAKHYGLSVIATVRSDAKRDAIRRFGADRIVNTKTESLADVLAETGADIVLDCVGGADMGKCFSLLNRFGRWIVLATLGGDVSPIDLKILYQKRLRLIGSTLRSRTEDEKASLLSSFSETFMPMFADGSIRPEIFRQLPMAEAEEAHRILQNNENIGKVILTLD